MDITRHNFWPNLLDVLEAIADAEFISVDLEMTGIVPKSAKIASPTADDIYAQAREAARTFQIPQIGLTCLEYHEESNGNPPLRIHDFLLACF